MHEKRKGEKLTLGKAKELGIMSAFKAQLAE